MGDDRTTDRRLVSIEHIESAIRIVRDHKVILDSTLAALYEVNVRILNQAVRRNIERFPRDFMFQLTDEEAASLRSQIVTLEPGRGRHRKYLPYAFTEQGVAMLSSVLRSRSAVQVNIEIMRLRASAADAPDQRRPQQEARSAREKYDAQFRVVSTLSASSCAHR